MRSEKLLDDFPPIMIWFMDKRACFARLCLSFKIGDSEPSAIFERSVLDRDKFPAFFAPAVEVVLDIFDYWFDDTSDVSGVDSCFYGDDFVFPFGHVGVTVLEFA